jgi:hypothetical protein
MLSWTEAEFPELWTRRMTRDSITRRAAIAGRDGTRGNSSIEGLMILPQPTNSFRAYERLTFRMLQFSGSRPEPLAKVRFNDEIKVMILFSPP